MKKIILTSTIAAVTLFSINPGHALEAKETKMKEAATFTSAVVGGLAAGPIGAAIGALAASYVGDRHTLVQNHRVLEANQSNIAALEKNLIEKSEQLEQMKKAVDNKLEFQVLFATGKDQLLPQDSKRIESLATYLKENPKLHVRLDGHADPRGTDEYNNVLSEERALSVIKALEEKGISRDRITYYSHGSSRSANFEDNLEAYALERRVNIEVYSAEQNLETTAMASTEQ